MRALGLDPDVEDDLNQDKTKLTTTSTDSQQDSSNGAVSEETSVVIPAQRQAEASASPKEALLSTRHACSGSPI
ncbi:hypothetical protein BHE90_001063 [Fusarium euwallaceae]|uniref:Uncharacterized protein n=1 Tax=Fusarium euwallaceae TaxID=1147111 RepID=A0A430M8U9_9HYPO|nr:hypothetical protein BHE90_001063 [Fusarium euwallaceae]